MGKIIAGGLKQPQQSNVPTKAPTGSLSTLPQQAGARFIESLSNLGVTLPNPSLTKQQQQRDIIAGKRQLPGQEVRAGLAKISGGATEPGSTLQELASNALAGLPLAAAGGVVSTLPSLGQYAIRSVGSQLGGKAGAAVGGKLGSAVGAEDLGRFAGSLAGGFGGDIAGGVASNLPSRFFPKKIEQAERSAFEANKAMKVAELEGSKSSFDKSKQQAINSNKTAISDYKKTIQDLDKGRSADYNKAIQLAGKTQAKAPDIESSITAIRSDITKGLSKTDQKLIKDNLASLSNEIKKNHGQLTVRDAKEFQKNFNDQIYNWDASIPFKRQMMRLTEPLKEFITKNSSEEHNQYWQKGEDATRQMKMLQRGEKEFLKTKNQELKDLSKEKFSPEKSALLKQTSEETFADFVKSKKSQDQASQMLEKVLDKANKWGLAGLASTIGYLGFGKYGSLIGGLAGKMAQKSLDEFKLAREVMNQHPEIYNEYKNLIVNATRSNTPQILARVNELGKKVEDLKKPKKAQGRITAGGLKPKPS